MQLHYVTYKNIHSNFTLLTQTFQNTSPYVPASDSLVSIEDREYNVAKVLYFPLIHTTIVYVTPFTGRN